MRAFVVFLLVFGSLSVSAQMREKFLEEFDPLSDRISDEYDAGPYLIYDCQKEHYVCVVQENFETCQSKKMEDLKNDSLVHRCAPLGKLTTKKACFQKQLFMVSNNAGKPFCTKEEWKKREIPF